jgi:hypothetical protein
MSSENDLFGFIFDTDTEHGREWAQELREMHDRGELEVEVR